MANFVIQFPLITEKYQEDILNKRFEIGRQMYNSLVTVTQKRYKEMIKIKLYRSIKAELKEIYSSTSKQNLQHKKELCKQLNELYKQYGLSEYSFHADVKEMQKHFKSNIDAFTTQKIATNLWKSYDKLLFGNGEYIHYKKYDSLSSLEGKSNSTGIRFKNNSLIWNGLNIPVKINNTLYEQQALQNDISYCRIVRKFVRSKYKFYLQIVFKGNPPIKVNQETGEIKNTIGNGKVGLDIGTRTIALSSSTDVKIFELADRIQNIENEKCRLLRKQDRSRRSTNPDNYNDDGTIKKQGNKKVVWVKSKRYIKTQNQLKELYRKQADIRKYQHECMANYIISLGDEIYVETMNYAGLQKRSIKTEKNENGKFKSKKRFGKSLANKAPSMLLTIIDRKLKYYDKQLFKIDTWFVKASQYNHFEENYQKKKLSQRWNEFNGIKVQRDMYSAFLIMNVNNDLKSINQQQCNKTFNNFLKLHDTEVQRLTGNKNLSSIAI
ncbi:MAG: transposase [Clostridia bacterium]|nr:transposase [Clostridia bacterium]